MYHPHHFLSQIKQMNQRTSVPAKRISRPHDPVSRMTHPKSKMTILTLTTLTTQLCGIPWKFQKKCLYLQTNKGQWPASSLMSVLYIMCRCNNTVKAMR